MRYAHAMEPEEINSYNAATAYLPTLGEAMVDKIGELVAAEERIVIKSITWRVKSLESARSKMAANAEKYVSFAAIDDMLRLRIVSLFEDDLLTIGEKVQKLIHVDAERTVDRASRYQPDQFGYRSLHYVGRPDLSLFRGEFPPDVGSRSVKIQIRSSLQDTWAEIEHDLGYKPQRAITYEVRRQFSQLAALMELADERFSALRQRLVREEESAVNRVDSIMAEPVTVANLHAYVTTDPEIRTLDQRVAGIVRRQLLPMGSTWRSRFGHLLDRLADTGIQTVQDLQRLVTEQSPSVLLRARDLTESERLSLEFPAERGLRPGFSILLLVELQK